MALDSVTYHLGGGSLVHREIEIELVGSRDMSVVSQGVSGLLDRYPGRLIDEKTDLLNRLLEEKGRLFFTHDHEMAMGRVAKDDRGRFFASETWTHLDGTTL